MYLYNCWNISYSEILQIMGRTDIGRKLPSLCIGVTVAFFQSSTNSPVDSDKLKINVKDEYITSAAIRSIFAGILSVPVLLDTFRYLRVIKNFLTGICEK